MGSSHGFDEQRGGLVRNYLITAMQLLSHELLLTLMRMREGGREQTCCCCSIHCLTNLLERLRKSFTSSSLCWIVGRSCRFIRSSRKVHIIIILFLESHRDPTPGVTALPCLMTSCRTRAQSLVQVLRGKLSQQHDNHHHDYSNYGTCHTLTFKNIIC